MTNLRRTSDRGLLGLAALAILAIGTGLPGQEATTTPTVENQGIVEVCGLVMDTDSAPIENAVIKAVGTDVSPVLSDSKGTYKFYLVGQTAAFTLTVSKDGYSSHSSSPVEPKRKVKFDAALSKAQAHVRITMDSFVANATFSGKVTGLAPSDVGRYKVLAYVLTDKWYIHPFAENRDRTGYSSIKDDGSWELRTVNRGHQAFQLALVVVPKEYMPPAVIESGEDAALALRGKFGANLVAVEIIAAPEGL